MKPSRKFSWLASADERNGPALDLLAHDMAAFYATNDRYYSDIRFTRDHWRNHSLYRYVAALLHDGDAIVEIGCGEANILTHHPGLASGYHGLEFSPEIVAANQRRHPRARFSQLTSGTTLPIPSASQDCVFSMFVLEHCVYPRAFLDECARVLKPGGTLILLCPEMLGRSRMTSQRLGFSQGTGREKLREGRWFDALVTGWDTRARLVVASWWRRALAARRPRFYVNMAPVCFADSFFPDFDAVYLACQREIVHYLGPRFRWQAPSAAVADVCQTEGLIFLHGITTAERAGGR